MSFEKLAELAGKRGCCSRGVCIHRQAKAAVADLAAAKAEIERLREALKRIIDEYDPYVQGGNAPLLSKIASTALGEEE